MVKTGIELSSKSMGTNKSYRGARLFNILDKIRSNETIFGIILAVMVGVIAGFGAVAFRWLIKSFQLFFFGGGASVLGFMGQYYIILLPAVGGGYKSSQDYLHGKKHPTKRGIEGS